jgi:phosphocarrier protein HPr
MRSIELAVTNATGLHARPAAVFVKAAAGFRSSIRVRNVERDGPPANAKSILAVLAQGAGHGSRIEITADGEDEDLALEHLARLVEDGLGEGPGGGEDAAGR